MDSSPNDDLKRDDDAKPVEHEEMPAALGFVSHANRTSDMIATGERVRDLRQRIKQLSEDCDQLQLQIASKERDRNAVEEHGRGWPLLVVILLGIVTIGLEYIPATQFTQIFDANDTQRSVFTGIFTVVPAVLAIALGELLRRLRVPSRQHTMDTILLGGVGILTLIFLAIGLSLRLAYTNSVVTSAIGLTPWMEAVALTSIATIGIALTVVSANYREGIPMYRISRNLAGLRRELAELENHLKTDQHDLERAEAAYRGEPVPAYSKWSARKPTPTPGAGNGVPPGSSTNGSPENGRWNGTMRDRRVSTYKNETTNPDPSGGGAPGGASPTGTTSSAGTGPPGEPPLQGGNGRP
ncbi:MAG TPA: hypothetical protein VIW69_13730 [Candidatus Elarobacter sp.]